MRILLSLTLALCAASAEETQELRMTVGKSIALDFASDIRQVSTTDPLVVDPMAVTTRELLLQAKGVGTATVVVWSKTGERRFYSVTVEQNLEPLRRLLKETFPEEDIHVQASRDAITLTGRVSSKEVSDRAAALSAGFAKTAINHLQIAPAPVERQIVLRVKFAELNRSAAQAFGVNLLFTGAADTIGRATTGQFPAPNAQQLRAAIPGRSEGTTSEFTITDALNVFAFRPDLNLAAFIKALQQRGVLQILAEPNLVTTDGKEASFLVGGEFPVPVVQGGAAVGAVTVTFREFGIRLSFKPLITEHGTIKMAVRPEVSAIDLANAVTLNGFLIPALSTRRMETNIELGRGQSFVIGGLLDDRVTETLQRVPGLANIPLLGNLFRSREERRSRTELVVIVTPEIASPLPPGAEPPLPPFPKDFVLPMDFSPQQGAPSPSAPGGSPARKTAHPKKKK